MKDDVFIAEQNVRPHINEVSEEWGRPWVFTCIFSLKYFPSVMDINNIFGNANAIPGMIFIGALLVPISGLIFFESNAFKTLVSLM